MNRDDIILSVPVGNGKYTVQQDRKGMLTALRYGEPWRDCCGDGLILTLAQEVSGLRAELKRLGASLPCFFTEEKSVSKDILCMHKNYSKKQIMDFYFNVCDDCGYQWKL